LEAQLGPLREQINELQGLVDGIPILQQSLECARLQVEQLPSLQEKANQSVNQIKLLELKLSNQEQEKKKLLRDLDAKRRRDVDIAKNASKLEAEKQVQAALNKEYQEFGGQVLQFYRICLYLLMSSKKNSPKPALRNMPRVVISLICLEFSNS
jgi:chromosome segregation ATPase